MAERYNTPAEGTLDWHVPLNENFKKLDEHVEVRDTDSNKDSYTPKSGAKFLATDTGAVYLGDGSSWNQIGTIAPSTDGGSGQVSDGSVVAAPGEVQSTIDQYNAGFEWGPQPMQQIKLRSGEVYRPDSTWRIRSGTILECNGAVIRPQGDFNVIEMERSATVRRPAINCADVSGYSSAAIVIQAPDSDKAGTPNPAHVYDCHVFNNQNTGVGVRFLGDQTPVSMQFASGKIHNFDRGLEFRARGSGTGSQDGWCNGNWFNGNINGSRIPIYLISENGSPVGGNTVRAQIQTSDQTEWIVRQEDAPADDTNIRDNTYIVHPWDTESLSNEFADSDYHRPPIWYIGRGQQGGNKMWSTVWLYSNEHIVNRATDERDQNDIVTGTRFASGAVETNSGERSFQVNDDVSYHPDS